MMRKTIILVEEKGQFAVDDMIMEYYDFDYILDCAGYTRDTMPTEKEFEDYFCYDEGITSHCECLEKMNEYFKAMDAAGEKLLSRLNYVRHDITVHGKEVEVGIEDGDEYFTVGKYEVWEKEDVK